MVDSPTDGSIRRATASIADSGTIIVDSRRQLEANPLLILEPGTEDISLNFEDKLGLIDSYGNVYTGYGGSGGSNTINVNDNNHADTVTSQADDANDGDLMIYIDAESVYLPFSFEDAGLARVSTSDLPADGEFLVFNNISGEYEPTTYDAEDLIQVSGSEMDGDILVYNFISGLYDPTDFATYAGTHNIVFTDGTAPAEGYILVYNVSQQAYVPVAPLLIDWAVWFIERPTNRTYPLALFLPFDIEITGTFFNLDQGAGTASFPSGPISSGSPANVTVSGTNGSSRGMKIQVNYIRVAEFQ